MKKKKKQGWSEQQLKKRLRFGKKHEDWDRAKWKSELQGVGDIKD